MQQRWMRIIESGSDRHVGAALVRLAERAARMHREEVAAPAGGAEGVNGHGDAPAEVGQAADPFVDDPHRSDREPER